MIRNVEAGICSRQGLTRKTAHTGRRAAFALQAFAAAFLILFSFEAYADSTVGTESTDTAAGTGVETVSENTSEAASESTAETATTYYSSGEITTIYMTDVNGAGGGDTTSSGGTASDSVGGYTSAGTGSTAPAVIYAGTYSSVGPGGGSWVQDEKGWWYSNGDGTYTTGGWQQINGLWYYFNDEGYMLADTWVKGDDGTTLYRVGSDGVMLTSQTDIEIDGTTYDIDANGAATAKEAPKSEEELQAESIAASIVSQITNDSMSKVEKANAIYDYVRGIMTYTSSGPKSDDAAGALYAFRRHSGCCFEYYAMSKYMLECAGMPSLRVVRASDGDHFWNLVNVDGTWYHFDTTPRRTGGRWCLVTTGYLQSHSWGAHNYNVSAYPQTP